MKFSVKSNWDKFNRWRRRGMPFRLVVLLIIGTGPFIEWNMTDQHIPLINELVWTACRAIRYGSEPRVASTLVRGYKARENRQLQNLLRRTVNDRKIVLTDIEQAELEQLPSKANLSILFDAAKRYNLLAKDASLRQLNRNFYALAIGTTALQFDNQWLEIKSMLYQKPDLTKWATWRSKIDVLHYLFLTILPLPIHIALLWAILIFSFSFTISGGKRLGWLRNSAVAVIPIMLVLSVIIFPYRSNNSLESFCLLNINYWNWQLLVYLSALSLIVSLYGIRLKRKLVAHGSDKWVMVTLLMVSGLILLFPFGLYMKTWIFPNVFSLFWRGWLESLRLKSTMLIIPLEISGAMLFGWALSIVSRQFGTKELKIIKLSIWELVNYSTCLVGGVIFVHHWLINFFSQNDFMQFNIILGYKMSDKGYFEQLKYTVHLEQNFALLVIVILLGVSLPQLKKMSKVNLIISSIMVSLMLVIIGQLCC